MIKILHTSSINKDGVFQDGKLLFKPEADEMGLFFKETYKTLGQKYSKFHKMDKYAKLAFLLNEVLLKPGFEAADKKQIAVVLANKTASTGTDLEFLKGIENPDEFFPSPSNFVYTLPNVMIGEICIRNKIFGENACFIMDHYNKETLLNYIGISCQSDTQYCIGGWVEPYGKNGFGGKLLWVEINA